MGKSCQTLGNLIQNITLEEARSWRDSGDGWTVTEVMCHLRDFDEFFMGRAEMMLTRDHPDLPAYDHEALAIERSYNAQDLFEVYADLKRHRASFQALYEGLTEDQWKLDGKHPERESFDMLDSLMQVGLHDVNHIEQISRIMAEKRVD
ncbi:MAG: DinB family protein [Chloroflexota bacterium]